MKTVHLRINRAGYFQPTLGKAGAAALTYKIINVPDDVSSEIVANKATPLTFWPATGVDSQSDAAWTLDWNDIANARPGQIIRTGGQS